MKKLIHTLLGIIILSVGIFAQDKPEKKFLFRTDKLQLQTFFLEIAPQTYFSQLNKQKVNVGVINAGFILNEKFTISFFMSTAPKVNLLTVPAQGSEEYTDWINAGVDLNKLSSSTEFVYVDFRHSGLKLGYQHNADKIVFMRGSLAFGFLGGLTLAENKSFMGLFNNNIYKESVITLAPEIGVGINLLNWWRIHFDIGYRFMNADTRIMSAADADSFTYSLSFAFGKFNN